MCSALVVGFVLAIVVVAQLPDHSVREVVPNMVGATLALARIAAIVAALPSLLAILICEWRSERRWWVYSAFSACLAAAASGVISGALAAPIDVLRALTAVCGCAAIGIAAGWVYWRLAGRFAGRRPLSIDVNERA
jgi:hypothetical protein